MCDMDHILRTTLAARGITPYRMNGKIRDHANSAGVEPWSSFLQQSSDILVGFVVEASKKAGILCYSSTNDRLPDCSHGIEYPSERNQEEAGRLFSVR